MTEQLKLNVKLFALIEVRRHNMSITKATITVIEYTADFFLNRVGVNYAG